MSDVIQRPDVDFDAVEHIYKIDGEDVLGVSTIAKIGGAMETWGIASAWGFRVGYEGTFALLDGRSLESMGWTEEDDLRAALKDAKLTPWDTRDKAADRGSWVHDVLEELGQDGAVHDPGAFAAQHGEEAAGHARSVMRWFLAMRPDFVATEVQVASRTHRFAGRYDIRCRIRARLLLACIDPLRTDAQAVRVREAAEHDEWVLVLLDLKTSKSIYPTTHFPQLEGYEGASVEMGFPPTDVRVVLNTWPTGDFDPARDVAVSWSTFDDFVAFLGALRAIRRIEAGDPEELRARAREAALLANLPATSRQLADLALPELAGMDTRAIGRTLGTLRKRGKVEQDARKAWHLPAPAECDSDRPCAECDNGHPHP